MQMSDEEIKVAASRKLIDERNALPINPEGPPAAVSPAILDFCRTLSPVAAREIPVVADPHGRYGWCNVGVAAKVAADGGAPVHGWCVVEWPPGLLTAEFHTVWMNSAGELIDITPKPWQWPKILFVEDPDYPANFNFDQRPRNRRHRTYRAVGQQARLTAQLDRLTGPRRAYEETRAIKAGLTLESWLNRKVPPDPLESAIDDFITLSGEFEAYYDTLGASGYVRPDAKFIALAKQRFASQQSLRRLMAQGARGSQASTGGAASTSSVRS